MRSRLLFIGFIWSAFIAVLPSCTSMASPIRMHSAGKISNDDTKDIPVVFISAFDGSATQKHHSSDGETLVPLSYDATTQGSITYLVQLDCLILRELSRVNIQPIADLHPDTQRIPSLTDYFRYSITTKAP